MPRLPFHVIGAFQGLALRMLGVGLFLLAITACADKPRTVPHPSEPVSVDDIREPLARIPVRQDVIRDAVPENKVVATQAEATKADVTEAGQAIDAVQAEQRALLEKQAATIAKLTDELIEAHTDAEKASRARMGMIKFYSTLGIGMGLISCIWLGRVGAMISLACVAMLVAVRIDAFVDRWAEPIIGCAAVVIALMLLWRLWLHLRASKQLALSTAVAIEAAGGMTTDLAGKLNDIQGTLTKNIVNRFVPKPDGAAP